MVFAKAGKEDGEFKELKEKVVLLEQREPEGTWCKVRCRGGEGHLAEVVHLVQGFSLYLKPNGSSDLICIS